LFEIGFAVPFAVLDGPERNRFNQQPLVSERRILACRCRKIALTTSFVGTHILDCSAFTGAPRLSGSWAQDHTGV